jgi:hypothetical protein
MPRGTALKNHEGTRAIRVRAPKRILQRLERMSPAEIGAWIYHADKSLERNDPALVLAQPPAPIPPEAEQEKPMNPRLAELLKSAKPITKRDLEFMKNQYQLTDEEREADERFWQEREEERRLEREAMLKELEDEAA